MMGTCLASTANVLAKPKIPGVSWYGCPLWFITQKQTQMNPCIGRVYYYIDTAFLKKSGFSTTSSAEKVCTHVFLKRAPPYQPLDPTVTSYTTKGTLMLFDSCSKWLAAEVDPSRFCFGRDPCCNHLGKVPPKLGQSRGYEEIRGPLDPFMKRSPSVHDTQNHRIIY